MPSRRVPATSPLQAHLLSPPCLICSAQPCPTIPWQDLPEHQGRLSYHSELPMAVDCLARSIEACDEAFFRLEGWAKQVGSWCCWV